MDVLDLTEYLRDWPHDDDESVRIFTGKDGREKVQMRVRIGTYNGLVQFECDGRPDGERPYGLEFALDYYEEELAAEGPDFVLSHEECEELFDEGAMTYERYVVLLQAEQWDRVLRETEEDRNRLERWWPYILRIHHTAKANKRLETEGVEAALEQIQDALFAISAREPMDDSVHEMERTRSLESLQEFRDSLLKTTGDEELTRLVEQKDEAVEAQDFERAAKLRDRIEQIRAQRNLAEGDD